MVSRALFLLLALPLAAGARMAGPKRMALVLLRDVGADTFVGSLVDGLRQNLSEADAARLKPQTDELVALMQKIGEAKKGMAIAGDEFYAALLRIWLGEKPVSDDMKKALLGAA